METYLSVCSSQVWWTYGLSTNKNKQEQTGAKNMPLWLLVFLLTSCLRLSYCVTAILFMFFSRLHSPVYGWQCWVVPIYRTQRTRGLVVMTTGWPSSVETMIRVTTWCVETDAGRDVLAHVPTPTHDKVPIVSSIVISMSVRLSVCLYVCLCLLARISQKPQWPKFKKFSVHVLVLARSSHDSGLCYVLSVLLMTSCFHIIEPIRQN